VLRDFDGSAYVYIVGSGNKATRRKVATERTYGTNWVVTSGLKAGDKVITQGTANLKTGAPIKPVPASAPQKVEPRAGGQAPGRRGG
jgi:membrane fusion protein (multidrug efflux system)